MNYPETIFSISRIIKPAMFYKEVNQIIFSIVLSMNKKGVMINLLSIQNELTIIDKLETIGGPVALSKIYMNYLTTGDLRYYANVIADNYYRRELIVEFTKGRELAYDTSKLFKDIWDEYFPNIMRINTNYNDLRYLDVDMHEKIILHNMIFNNHEKGVLFTKVKPEYFSLQHHELFFEALKHCFKESLPMDEMTITDYFENNKKSIGILYKSIEKLKGMNWKLSFEKMYGFFVKRKLNIISEYINRDRPIKDITALLKDFIDNNNVKDSKSRSINDIASEIESNVVNNTVPSLLTTGSDDLDNALLLSDDQIFILGGARGMGKTREMVRIITNIMSYTDNVAVCWVSLEDSEVKLTRCIYSIHTGLTGNQIQQKKYKLSPEEKQKLVMVRKNIFPGYDIEFNYDNYTSSEAMSMFKIFQRRKKEKHCIFVLDNIVNLKDNDDRTETESKILKTFKEFRVDSNKDNLRSTIILLHHLNKQAEDKENLERAYRMNINDLRGSGTITTVASLVAIYSRPAAYKDLVDVERVKPNIKLNGDEYSREDILSKLSILEIVKNRDGEMTNDDIALYREYSDLGTMQFLPLKEIGCS